MRLVLGPNAERNTNSGIRKRKLQEINLGVFSLYIQGVSCRDCQKVLLLRDPPRIEEDIPHDASCNISLINSPEARKSKLCRIPLRCSPHCRIPYNFHSHSHTRACRSCRRNNKGLLRDRQLGEAKQWDDLSAPYRPQAGAVAACRRARFPWLHIYRSSSASFSDMFSSVSESFSFLELRFCTHAILNKAENANAEMIIETTLKGAR